MKIYSGSVCMGECGVPVADGLHTGDIVQIWHADSDDPDRCIWTPIERLSAVVTDMDTGEHFVMGIKACGFSDPQWRVVVVKKWSDVVDGEHWPAYGFRYSNA